jgi:chemotaxis protein MotB
MKMRNLVLLAVLAAAVTLAGCSCKEYEEQIMALDAQIADLQQQLGEREATLAECNDLTDELRKNIKEAEMENAVLVEKMNEVVVIDLDDTVQFASGQAMVLENMVPALQAIATTLQRYPDWDIFVEGHTDDKKILEEYQEKWPSNWELGAFRSSAVTRYLTNDLGLGTDRFAVVSYGPYRPIADNETADGRSQNRRVRIVLHKPEK